MKRICFLTGTRADFGKIKSLMKAVNDNDNFEIDVFVTGMHLSSIHGDTYNEVLKENFRNISIDKLDKKTLAGSMSLRLGEIITNFTKHINTNPPDMIVVHGDRIEAMAGALVAALNNIRLGHIEGGEVTGTIDESLRHAISKLANEHFVSNTEAAKCLEYLGEAQERIHVIGSPDLDAMNAAKEEDLNHIKSYYEIPFNSYGIALYHPVTTEIDSLDNQTKQYVDALIESKKNWVVIYPNNDLGYNIILKHYNKLRNNNNFRIIPSIRFEYFLTLLFNSDVMIGNSSAGVRETCVYGIPAVDIGSRQSGRYDPSKTPNVTHASCTKQSILKAINQSTTKGSNKAFSNWGTGNSASKFIEILSNDRFWETTIQKKLPFQS